MGGASGEWKEPGSSACSLRCGFVAATLVLVAAQAFATVPMQLAFQGLLTDDAGVPLDQSVALEFEFYDAITGGVSLWSESHPGTPVVEGVYEVVLGSINPLTPAVLEGGAVFLQIRVDGEDLVPRDPLLAAPYALRAAETAEFGGIDSSFITQLWLHGSFDGGDPPNDDPSEGLLDSDGDGIANFLESDNDADGLSDAAELAGGTNLNSLTPMISQLLPSTGDTVVPTLVTVAGSNFDVSQTVTAGGQTLVPQNLSSNSFEIVLGPHAPGSIDVGVEDPGGDSDSASFVFAPIQPLITSFSPLIGDSGATQIVQVQGSGFLAGLSVTIGSENPVPTNVTSTSFEVGVGPQPEGAASVVVTNSSGLSDTTTFDFVDISATRFAFLTQAAMQGDFGGLAAADAICQQEASAAGLPGSYLAWLATSNADDPNSRFVQHTGPYRLANGTLLANDYADLTDGTLADRLRITASGVNLDIDAWTNVDRYGDVTTTAFNSQCLGWTSSDPADFGPLGDSNSITFHWTEDTARKCDLVRALYCFQQ